MFLFSILHVEQYKLYVTTYVLKIVCGTISKFDFNLHFSVHFTRLKAVLLVERYNLLLIKTRAC